ncbi:MAG: histidine kinase [Ktedonobacteraceae bacterium]
MTVEHQQAANVTHVDSANVTTTLLSGRWLFLARVGWIAIALLALGLYISSVPSYFASLHVLCTSTPVTCRNNGQITPNYLRTLQTLGFSLDFFALYKSALFIFFAFAYAAIGAVIFWRKSTDRMALFASLTLVVFPAGFNSSELATLPAILLLPAQIVALLGNSLIFLFFYLFPTGKFVPRWTRWLSVSVIVFWVVTSFFPSLPFKSFIIVLGNVVFLGFICSLVVTQVYRYRHVSNAGERQQTKWVVFGLSIGLGGVLLIKTFSGLFPSLVPYNPLADSITTIAPFLFLLLIPISIAFAILRSRLWDIDSIINRTLVYGLLTATVVGLYILVVGGLSALLQSRGNILISLVATGLVAVLFQPLRQRLQRTVNHLTYGERDDPYRIISRLGQRLEVTLIPDAILPVVVETVAQALKLPYVAIELQEEGAFHQVATYGTAVEAELRIPLRYQQEIIGQLLLASRSPGESFSATDRRLLDDLARQAGIAANAVHLSADLQRSHERLLLAREEERRRLARELHDSVSQALYGISLGAHAARTALDRDPEHVAEPLDYILTLAEVALAEMRALIFELRPESLETEGLVSALSKQAAAWQARNAISVATELCDEPDLPLPVKEDLYRIAQEAMHNTVKHAHASHVDLRLEQTAEGVTMEVWDDGAGFDPSASYPGHLGLHSMRERVANLGGKFQIESPPGQGTMIRAHVPTGHERRD